MSLLSRITSGASTLVKNIHVSQGGPILLGRQASGAGKAQEIVIGDGLTLSGLTLSADASSAWNDITGKPSEFPPSAHTHTFSSLTSKPTTLAGYGITDTAPTLITASEYDSVVFDGGAADGVELEFDSMFSGRPAFSAPVVAGPGSWVVAWDGVSWKLTGNGIEVYSAIGDTALPTDAEWQGGTITLAPVSVNGSAVGQLRRRGATSPYLWYRWDGTAWNQIDAPQTTLTASKVVANAAARLALSAEDAEGFAVVEADTGKSYMLVSGGNPATSGDWLQLGDRDIQWSDVGGKPTIPTVDNESINAAIEEDPAASLVAMGAAPSALQKPTESLASSILVHDDCSGPSATVAAAGTRACYPGPGTMTVGAAAGSTEVRYENGTLRLTPLPLGSNNAVIHYGAQTVVAGLAMKVRLIPGFRKSHGGLNTSVGFSSSSSSALLRRGMINITATNTDDYATVNVSDLSTDASDSAYFAGAGVFEPGEEIALCVHYKTTSHQQYFMQGGRAASMGCEIGSDNWFLLGETFTALSGTVYPLIAEQFRGTAIIKDVEVLTSFTPSQRHRTFDYSRTNLGIHVSSFGTDPVSGLTILGWNSSTAHTGANMSAIRYTTKLASGTWTDPTNLLAAPSDGSGQSIQSLSVVNGSLWLIYWKQATGLDGGTLYRRTCTVNASTGAITLGTETLLGVTGTRNLSFSPIITLPSGRLLIPYHKNDGSPANNSYVSYSDDNGTTWTEGVIAASIPAGTTVLYEPTLVIESDGAVGCMMRTSASVAYYSRCADPTAATLVWSTPAAVKNIPQPGANGSRMQYTKLDDGTILLIGNDSREVRKNITMWRMGDGGTVLEKTFVGDWETIGGTTNIMQYPAIQQDGDDLLIAYSHQPNGGGSLSCSIRLHTWRWASVIARETGGTGKRDLPRPVPVRPVVPSVFLAYGTAPVPDLSKGPLFYITLTASTAVIGAPLNPMPWEELTLVFVQGGTGSYTATFNAVFEFGGITPTWQTAVSATNILKATYNPITAKWIVTQWR